MARLAKGLGAGGGAAASSAAAEWRCPDASGGGGGGDDDDFTVDVSVIREDTLRPYNGAAPAGPSAAARFAPWIEKVWFVSGVSRYILKQRNTAICDFINMMGVYASLASSQLYQRVTMACLQFPKVEDRGVLEL